MSNNNDKLVKDITDSVVAITNDINIRLTNVETMVQKIYQILSEKKTTGSAKSTKSTTTTSSGGSSSESKPKTKVAVPKMLGVWFKKKYKEDEKWRKALIEKSACKELFEEAITGFSAETITEDVLKGAWKAINTTAKKGENKDIVKLKEELEKEHKKELESVK